MYGTNAWGYGCAEPITLFCLLARMETHATHAFLLPTTSKNPNLTFDCWVFQSADAAVGCKTKPNHPTKDMRVLYTLLRCNVRCNVRAVPTCPRSCRCRGPKHGRARSTPRTRQGKDQKIKRSQDHKMRPGYHPRPTQSCK